ncbi:MAG: macro domain-containing protein [Prevotella sp.]|jgi:O-acetyl-ADP-ribose deacetylase (regulator of RNase III)|nr:macro domain-containing protein [Prevotella sp.]MCI2088219.1 macro domain-containing protein [Prevotella sp.]MCI2125746.1 macro domain-containing protein [Prevotella sp.]
MIKTTRGNLLESDAQALVNTVNTVGVMGKGIALQFREAFPDNYLLYKKACKEGKVHIGEMFTTIERRLERDRYIINFPTKTTWRRSSEYSYIESGLVALRNEIINRHITSIAIPPLGTHNGGLDWSRVKQMILGALDGLDCTIYLYEPSEEIIERLKTERVKLTPARAMMLDLLCDMKSYGEFASVFAAEKVVYFLQKFGAKAVFKIQYQRGFYGPYSGGKISHLLYYLNGSYIQGVCGMQMRPFEEVWILPDTPSTVTEYLGKQENEAYRNICEETKAFLRGYYSNSALELLSTVDFILANDSTLRNWMHRGDVLEKINIDIRNWNQRKERLYYNSDFLPEVLAHLKDFYISRLDMQPQTVVNK